MSPASARAAPDWWVCPRAPVGLDIMNPITGTDTTSGGTAGAEVDTRGCRPRHRERAASCRGDQGRRRHTRAPSTPCSALPTPRSIAASRAAARSLATTPGRRSRTELNRRPVVRRSCCVRRPDVTGVDNGDGGIRTADAATSHAGTRSTVPRSVARHVDSRHGCAATRRALTRGAHALMTDSERHPVTAASLSFRPTPGPGRL